jgi:predicted nucleic-acid-binding protein
LAKPLLKTGRDLNAVDTNVLVRFLTEDEPEQAARARNLFESGTVFVPLTVLLETYWVLHKAKNIPSDLVLGKLVAITRMTQVSVEDSPRFDRVIALTDAGMEFADALHVTAVNADMRFATFDRRMIRAAQRCGLRTVYSP